VFLLLKVIQEYVLGEYDDNATAAYHENISESADEDHYLKDASKRFCTKISYGKK
jgi:protein OS-9